ncbi:LGFP repeat protein [Microbacterium trichothecenolyticum]|uniref:LGFP repeat protein n=1 Tax=Microbacterium trichothecenolyticum TaxID=69370 RepID=A0A0M2HB04_MICTR|nr:LGFP repeat protein [Microbacterium trichothecenolyticum]
MLVALLIVPAGGAATASPKASTAADAASRPAAALETASQAAASIRPAADLSRFQPGHIISDAIFFDSNAMSEGVIQWFLESQVPRCEPGYTCLRDWYDTSRAVPADAMCAAYPGGARERASTIIYKVAKACGINPQVILATLQKEQGLVTHVWPSDWRYTAAMGQGCPDTAACDARYYGFFNQVYGAAWQLKRYANPPGTSQYFTWYAPGKTWNVRFHPDASCGSSPVYVQNQATSDLYYYTPYQPNAASLRAGSGTGDSCSSYGNRNFFRYFTDWFGDPAIDVFGAILGTWTANGGAGGLMGRPMAPEACDWNPGTTNCSQTFANGTIVWSPAGGSQYIAGAINSVWTSMRSTFGVPLSGESCQWTGAVNCTQRFANGTIVWTPQRGVIYMLGAINATWQQAQGVVGLPIGPESCVWTGEVSCVQEFERGGIVWGPNSGAQYIGAGLYAYWKEAARGTVGLPIGSEVCSWTGDANCVQEFQRGALVWSAVGGLRYMGAGIHAYWKESARNVVGLPIGNESCVWTGDANCVQEFQRGALVWSAVGGLRYLGAGIHAFWKESARSVVGLPTSNETCVWGTGANCVQQFQRGAIVWSAAYGLHYVAGAIHAAWTAASPPIGVPVGDEQCVWSGDVRCVQKFETGSVTWRPATGPIVTRP